MQDSMDEIEAVLAMINSDAPVVVAEPEEEKSWTQILAENEAEDALEAAALAVVDGSEGVGGIEPAEVEEEVIVDDADIDAALAEVEAQAVATPATSTKTKAPKAPKQPKAAAVVVPQRKFTDVAAIDEETKNKALDECTAKKVTEKALNVIQAIELGRKLSRYTSDAVKKLKEDGRVSSKSLVEEFLAKNLGEGTARAQSQQMTALFKMLGIATPDPSNPRDLVISDTALVDELVLLAA